MDINYLIPTYNDVQMDKNRGTDLFSVSAIYILVVEVSDKRATGMGTKKCVSRKNSRLSVSHGYRVSNNFK